MKPIIKFKIGSAAFFDKLPGYETVDNDWLAIMDSFIPGEIMMNVKLYNDDIFFYRNNLSKYDFIEDTFKSNVPMRVGKFLVPEFAKYIEFTIDDLKQFDDIFNQLDDKHKYEKIIYESYIENNDFILTDEQLNKAYDEYKKYRSYEYQQQVFEQNILNVYKNIHIFFPNRQAYLIGSSGLYVHGIKLQELPHDIDLAIYSNDIKDDYKKLRKIRKEICSKFKCTVDIQFKDIKDYNESNIVTIELNGEHIKVETVKSMIEYKTKYMNMFKDKNPVKYEKHKRQLEYLKETNQI